MKTIREYDEWSTEVDSLMLLREEDKEAYFRSVLSNDFKLSCEILGRTFFSGIYSLSILYEKSREILDMSRRLAVSPATLPSLPIESYVTSSETRAIGGRCEIARFFDGMDSEIVFPGMSASVAILETSEFFERTSVLFLEWFLPLGRRKKITVIRDAVAFVSKSKKDMNIPAHAVTIRLSSTGVFAILKGIRDGVVTEAPGGWYEEVVGSIEYVLERESLVDAGLTVVSDTWNALFRDEAYPTLSILKGGGNEEFTTFINSLIPHFGTGVANALALA